jgi:hypothetical protein
MGGRMDRTGCPAIKEDDRGEESVSVRRVSLGIIFYLPFHSSTVVHEVVQYCTCRYCVKQVPSIPRTNDGTEYSV